MSANTLGSIALLTVMAWTTPGAATPCDPKKAELDHAKLLTNQGDYGRASAILETVLRTNADNFRANYQKGLIALSQVDAIDRVAWSATTRSPQGYSFADGMGFLLKAVRILPALDQACAKAANFYTVYNTAGAEYLNRARFREAEPLLLKGYEKRSMLTTSSRLKVTSNLGLLYYSMAKFDLSRRYYREAAAGGSASAHYQLAAHQQLAARP